jgi:peroxiredoxin (alkyl hydroperoxide reductase subunit C)
LLSDFWPHGEVTQRYGVFNAKLGRPDRAIFLVDKQGVVRWAKRYEPGILPDNAEVLQALDQLT